MATTRIPKANYIDLPGRWHVLIVERIAADGTALPGNIYCGLCGVAVGRIEKSQKIPCNMTELRDSMLGKDLRLELVLPGKDPAGARHTVCGQALYMSDGRSTQLKFISLRNYLNRYRQ